MINNVCRLKTIKNQGLNPKGLYHSLQPIQKLFLLEKFFITYLQERFQWSLVNFLILHFVVMLISHLDVRLSQTCSFRTTLLHWERLNKNTCCSTASSRIFQWDKLYQRDMLSMLHRLPVPQAHNKKSFWEN